LVLLALATSAPLACSTADTLHREVFRHPAAKQDSDPISGEWDVTFHVQNTKTPATFKLKLDGDKVFGTAYSDHTGPGTLRDGSWKNNQLSFNLDFAKHESIAVHRRDERWDAERRISHRRLLGEVGSEAEIKSPGS